MAATSSNVNVTEWMILAEISDGRPGGDPAPVLNPYAWNLSGREKRAS
jgi:hypothetical protein